jgi:hypothetical protein
MTAYTAEFTDKIITRNSDRIYGFAWAIFDADGSVYKSGFSLDRDNAEKAAAAELPRPLSARDRKLPGLTRVHAKMAKERGFASVEALRKHWDDETAARRASMRIEIVEVSAA